jgi:hypothetical protein
MSVFQEKVNPYYCFMRGYTRGLCPSARCPFAPGTGLRGVLPLYEGPPSLVQFYWWALTWSSASSALPADQRLPMAASAAPGWLNPPLRFFLGIACSS